MVALQIADIRDFTAKLFLGEVFDSFCLVQADITTYNTFSIDGRIQREFLDSDELELLDKNRRTLSLWKETKPFCLSIIRGKRTPVSFKIVFQLSHKKAEAFLSQANQLSLSENINGFYLNLQFKNKSLLCTTGVSQKTFVPDRQAEQLWDNLVLEFFSSHRILFEKL